MFKTILLTAFTICIMSLSIKAQSICGTPAIPQPIGVNIQMFPNRETKDLNSSYFLKLYFHVVKSSNGNGGVSTTIVQSAYNMLNDYPLS